jgi:hypothetical protein
VPSIWPSGCAPLGSSPEPAGRGAEPAMASGARNSLQPKRRILQIRW